MKTLNSYSVTMIDDNETIFEASYLNYYDNSNLAIEGAIDILSEMDDDEHLGILVVKQVIRLYDDKSEHVDQLHSIYNHIHDNKSNWVTAKEAKQFLMSIHD